MWSVFQFGTWEATFLMMLQALTYLLTFTQDLLSLSIWEIWAAEWFITQLSEKLTETTLSGALRQILKAVPKHAFHTMIHFLKIWKCVWNIYQKHKSKWQMQSDMSQLMQQQHFVFNQKTRAETDVTVLLRLLWESHATKINQLEYN